MVFLTHDEVHLWRVPLDGSAMPALAAALSADERRRAARYRFARHRREFLQARAAMRHILAGYVGVHPAELRFRYLPNGKPMLDGHVHFNLSHADAFALVAVASSAIGVDVERLDPQFAWEPVAAHFFSPPERA